MGVGWRGKGLTRGHAISGYDCVFEELEVGVYLGTIHRRYVLATRRRVNMANERDRRCTYLQSRLVLSPSRALEIESRQLDHSSNGGKRLLSSIASGESLRGKRALVGLMTTDLGTDADSWSAPQIIWTTMHTTAVTTASPRYPSRMFGRVRLRATGSANVRGDSLASSRLVAT